MPDGAWQPPPQPQWPHQGPVHPSQSYPPRPSPPQGPPQRFQSPHQEQPYPPQPYPPQSYPWQGHPPAGPPPGRHQPPAQQAYPPPQPPAPPARPPRGAGRIVGGVIVGGFGLLAALGGAGIVAQAVSNSRQEITDRTYVRNLWRNLPVETLFPASIGVRDPDSKVSAERGWTRVAISQDTSCEAALSGDLAATAAERGCVAALRATYLDPTGGTAATAAVVAFSEEEDRNDLDMMVRETQREKRGADQAVHALAAPGLQWKDAFRAGSGGGHVYAVDAPLFVVVTSGPADGRRAGRLPGTWGRRELQQLEDLEPWAETATGLARTLAARLAAEAGKARA
ncbi:hypothetical protein [Streptosporangium carneum]|uniref:Uncharacterized protein n=1 Tax=Streptosporangium carneum TaxID=47481 RepID=A0A9W6I2F5_9ACTN|nr:hypothetical protein GCM10017600_31310 [Streptosporangium carneum]